MNKFLIAMVSVVTIWVLALAPLTFASDVTITNDGSGNVAVNIPEGQSWDGSGLGAVNSLTINAPGMNLPNTSTGPNPIFMGPSSQPIIQPVEITGSNPLPIAPISSPQLQGLISGSIPISNLPSSIPSMANSLGGTDFRPVGNLNLSTLQLGSNDRIIMEDGAVLTAGSPALANVPGANGAIQATQSGAGIETVMNLETTQSAMTVTQSADGTIQFQ